MILVDNRAGSKELYPLLPKAKTTLTRLDFGDIALDGNGPTGPVLIGIEHKTVGDVLSCIMDGRFAAHQLPGLLESYDYSYLMIEGRTRRAKDGLLWWFHESKRKWILPYGGSQRKPISIEAWVCWLNTMHIQGGISLLYTENKKQSAHYIKSLSRWWSKPWSKHSSLKVFNESARVVCPLTKVSTRRLMIAQLPGVGWEKSAAIAKHFPSVLAMALASPEEWQSLPGIGKVLAAKITGELTNT